MSKTNYRTTRNSKSKEFLGSKDYINYNETQSKQLKTMFPTEICRYMNKWEFNFIKSLKYFTSKWSSKQVEIMNKIYNKYKNETTNSCRKTC